LERAGVQREDAPMTTPAQTRTFLTHNGETRSLVEWSRLLGLSKMTIYKRLRAGDSPERALRPAGNNGRPRVERPKADGGPTAEERIRAATGLPLREIREALRGGRTEAEMVAAVGRRVA
jgi:hypothetical protein